VEYWDTLDETHDQQSAKIMLAQTSHSVPDGSAPNETNLHVELQTIGLPSNKNVTPGHEDIELLLRKNQAKAHLTPA